jgi:signal transduction histidine kinase
VLRRERCDLAVVCREAASEESASLGRPVTLHLPSAPVEASVDRERICEAVKHLVSNALKYSPADRPVELSLRADEEAAVIAVRDEGPGIAADEVPCLFERFHRVPGVDVQVSSHVGLGLGLYIAKAIVEQHGGRVEVETAPGRGSTFTITLPRAAG